MSDNITIISDNHKSLLFAETLLLLCTSNFPENPQCHRNIPTHVKQERLDSYLAISNQITPPQINVKNLSVSVQRDTGKIRLPCARQTNTPSNHLFCPSGIEREQYATGLNCL